MKNSRQKLSQEELDKVIKDSYRTLISIRKKGDNQGNADNGDDTEVKKENLKSKYSRFTKLLNVGTAT